MEADVLGGLHFELTVPTSKTFLRRFLKAAVADAYVHGRASAVDPRCRLSLYPMDKAIEY